MLHVSSQNPGLTQRGFHLGHPATLAQTKAHGLGEASARSRSGKWEALKPLLGIPGHPSRAMAAYEPHLRAGCDCGPHHVKQGTLWVQESTVHVKARTRQDPSAEPWFSHRCRFQTCVMFTRQGSDRLQFGVEWGPCPHDLAKSPSSCRAAEPVFQADLRWSGKSCEVTPIDSWHHGGSADEPQHRQGQRSML